LGAEILIKTSFIIRTIQAGRISQFKGNLSVVTSDPPRKDGIARFTILP